MSRLSQVFDQRKQNNQKTFVGYLTAGDPDLGQTKEFCKLMAESGVDVIELGVPFSDPLADGPTNQKAAERGLASGTTLEKILQMAKELRSENFETPLVIFSYANPIHCMGYEKFAQEAKDAGVDGVLCVDLPPEEGAGYIETLKSQGIDTVFLASPTTEESRLNLIENASSGFVYYVSRTGVTGTQSEISSSLQSELEKIRQHIKKPLAIGFGISNAEQAREISQWGDGIVVGSAIVNHIERSTREPQAKDDLRKFLLSIREAIG